MKTVDTDLLINSIISLKREKNAVILAHYYQPHINYKIADIVGDSLELSRKAININADRIIFAGVHFMAEMAKVLNYDKKVLLPNLNAKCEMAEMVSPNDVRELRNKYPSIPVVAYVNTSAAVKAEADICCTSRNAIDIVSSLKSDKIIFIPDENMAKFVRLKTGKLLKFPKGYCYVHKEITPEIIKLKKSLYPNAVVLAHPECKLDVLNLADYITSTSGMIEYINESNEIEFIIATEDGLIDELKEKYPNKKFYSTANVCRGMKEITLNDIKKCLENDIYEINVDEEIALKAKDTITKMLDISFKNKQLTNSFS